MLFAQAGGFGKAGPGAGINEGALIAILGGLCVFWLVMLAVAILFLLTLMRTLQQVRPRNRAMEPAYVWLNFVPFLNIVWPFLTIIWMAKSLDGEFRDRGLHQRGEDYGKKLGLTGLTTYIVAYVVGYAIQIVGTFSGAPVLAVVGLGIMLVGFLVYLVTFTMYWVKIAGFRKELQEGGGRDEYDDDRDAPYRDSRRDDRYDDEDDQPRRREREDGDDDDRGDGYRRRYS